MNKDILEGNWKRQSLVASCTEAVTLALRQGLVT